MSIFNDKKDIIATVEPFAGWGKEKYTLDHYGAHYEWVPQNELGSNLLADDCTESNYKLESISMDVRIKHYLTYDDRSLKMILNGARLEFIIRMYYGYSGFFRKNNSALYHETINLSRSNNKAVEIMYDRAMTSLLDYVKNNWLTVKELLWRDKPEQNIILKNALTNYEYL